MFAGIFVSFVTLNSLHIAHAASKKIPGTGYEDPFPIKYPGPVRGDLFSRYGTNDNVMPIIPRECEGKSFCTVKPPDYPQEQFNSMFKGKKQVPQVALVPEDTFDNRQGDPSETDGCETRVTYEPLYQVRSKRDGDWRTVIQAPDENFVQRVRLEECSNPKEKCFAVAIDLGIETFCKQKFNQWEVLVADGKGGSERIIAQLPVCCSCNYRL